MGAALLALGFLAGLARGEVAAPDTTRSAPATPGPRVVIDTGLGRIVIELLPATAPKHVAQFLDLVRQGFYDGTTFHRVIPGFLIQGGDPNTKDEDPSNDGYGGIEKRRLEPEFSALPFNRGSVGMARDYRADGASCQFFIVLARSEHLDRKHTLFGRVVRGLEVADRIALQKANPAGRPEEPVPMTIVEATSESREAP